MNQRLIKSVATRNFTKTLDKYIELYGDNMTPQLVLKAMTYAAKRTKKQLAFIEALEDKDKMSEYNYEFSENVNNES